MKYSCNSLLLIPCRQVFTIKMIELFILLFLLLNQAICCEFTSFLEELYTFSVIIWLFYFFCLALYLHLCFYKPTPSNGLSVSIFYSSWWYPEMFPCFSGLALSSLEETVILGLLFVFLLILVISSYVWSLIHGSHVFPILDLFWLFLLLNELSMLSFMFASHL